MGAIETIMRNLNEIKKNLINDFTVNLCMLLW